MKVGIHKDNYREECEFLKCYETILKSNGIDCIWLDINDQEFWVKLKELDLFIFRWTHFDNDRNLALTILPVIEKNMNIKVFPDYNTCWHFDDKIKQYYLLTSQGYPFTKCWVFWERDKALEWLKNAKYPFVFKLKVGAGSSNVVKIENEHDAKKITNTMFGTGVKSGNLPLKNTTDEVDFSLYKYLRKTGKKIINRINNKDVSVLWQIEKNYVLFQEFLPNNTFDTRITVIGDRAFGFRRLTRKNDFRASGSGNIDYDASKIDLNCVKLAFKISKELGFQSMAYDFLYNQNMEAEICEISYTYQDRAIFKCSGFWDNQLKWHEGHFWPQYCQLVDMLGMHDLKQPDIKLGKGI